MTDCLLVFIFIKIQPVIKHYLSFDNKMRIIPRSDRKELMLRTLHMSDTFQRSTASASNCGMNEKVLSSVLIMC